MALDADFHSLSQFLRHSRLDVEPALPCRRALMEQHTDAVKGAMASLTGIKQKRCFQRYINDIRGDRLAGKRVETDIERRFALHTLAGHVYRYRHA